MRNWEEDREGRCHIIGLLEHCTDQKDRKVVGKTASVSGRTLTKSCQNNSDGTISGRRVANVGYFC